jgi:deoxyadenosine/deoxycytidine kinase
LYVDRALWNDDPASPATGRRGIYVAISGNTGAGKSSLINGVVELAGVRELSVLGVSERSFHHPLLRLMFSDPGNYAFGIQLAFMLQRHLFLLRQLELGRILVIERSHLDDELFVREHLQAGNITDRQQAAYHHLAGTLHERLPMPDALVLMDVPPAVSLERIRHSEESGTRPREFPDEDSKARWVHRWHELYTAFHADLRRRGQSDPRFARTKIIDYDATRPTMTLAEQLADLIAQLDRAERPA